MSEYRNLTEIINGISADDEVVQHIFVLTYEFDENQLINLLTLRDLKEEAPVLRRELLELARIRPLVVYDAAKTKEGRSLPQLLELHPWKSRAFGCHHSKAYCIVTDVKVHLALGSFNLTQSGLFHNREVMEYFCWSEKVAKNKDGHILHQWVAFLRKHYLSRMNNSEHSVLEQLIGRLDVCTRAMEAPAQGDSALVFSGYNAGQQKSCGLETLRELWTQWFPDEEPTGIFVVSPFFDQNPTTSCVAKEFYAKFTSLTEIDICTSEENKSVLCKGHFAIGSKAKRALRCIPHSIGEAERKIISREASEVHIKVNEDQIIERKLHAKIILLFNGERGISYAGSANFSCNAWLGRNQELGVARKVKNISTLRKQIVESLYVEDKNIYNMLPEIPKNSIGVLDDEEEMSQALFPDFVEHIVLERNAADNSVQFILCEAENGKSSIDDYSVTWGVEPLALTFTEKLSSQRIKATDWQMRLLGGRNLAFCHQDDPSQIFWFPFQYSGAIINEKEYLLNITSADWFQCYTSNSDSGGKCHQKFYKTGHGGSAVDNEIDRESNAVISMQRYLQQFGSAENNFRCRVASAVEGKSRSKAKQKHCAELLHHTVVVPLRTLFMVLRKEHKEQPLSKDAFALTTFRLGELFLFIKELAEHPNACDGIFASLLDDMKKYFCDIKKHIDADDPTLRSYIAFVLRQAKTA